MSDIIRVVRIVIHEGPREIIEEQLKGSISGTKRINNKNGVHYITAHSLEEFLQIIKRHEIAILALEEENNKNDS